MALREFPRQYEMLYILNPDMGEDNIPAAIEKVNTLITRLGGEVIEVNQSAPWGRRRMTYSIEKQPDGYYVLETFRISPTKTLELQNDLRISEDVLRHMLISLEEKK
jgi:small subunit ribosomal protein S6